MNEFKPARLRGNARQTAWLAVALVAGGLTVPAQAQILWPSSPDNGSYYYVEPDAAPAPRPARAAQRRPQKLPDAPKDTAKPQGPIIITISIENQHLKLYDSNGLFAESPVSTGMKGHSTPMGVFSIIQKNKYHRSNIYSGAPMPYMQRITWSGIALHAGVLPGYPASHGCIRMPMNFAMRMWGWTRMGARVIITPGEVSPTDIADARLIARKPDEKLALAPTAGQRSENSTTPRTDKSQAAFALDAAELRLKPITDRNDEVRTADASGAVPSTASDAGGEPAPAKDVVADKAESIAETSRDSVPKPSGDAAAEAKPDKDQSRASDPAMTAAPVSIPSDGSAEFIGPVKPRSGHLAAYVSRKDNKLYVRQNFEPWFEVPVTIAAPDRPLGTHVFTARADKSNADAFLWSVVSLPARNARRAESPAPRRGRNAVVADVAPVSSSSPQEALDRLSIPEDAMKRIALALAPGGSLIVSDQGLGDETGRGTDFIVPLR